MNKSDTEQELLSLISDYKAYKSITQASLHHSTYHAFRHDLVNIIKMCDEQMLYLKSKLKSLKEGDKDEILRSE